MKFIQAVPTNVITGALGVGKTTLIQHLLKIKPKAERWAILVNEFGEVGIDAALIDSTEQQGIFIREVPGGCMCCASSLPMQIALNQLLAKAKPDRLLIEPTGLGHPKEVLDILCAEHYRPVLDMRATLTLVDARKVEQPRWRAHQTFREQCKVADHIIVTKADLYATDEMQALEHYLAELELSNTPITIADKGKISRQLLTSKSSHSVQPIKLGLRQQTPESNVSNEQPNTDTNGVVRKSNQGEGFYAKGWIWPPCHWFNYDEVIDITKNIKVNRLKAVIITENGIFSINRQDDEVTITEMDDALDSRLEFITDCASEAERGVVAIESLFKPEQPQ